jgi:crotonobetainyl-CoA:carnitine CoA-transferase CaiB-like acyl-CoA transferase
MVMKKLSLGNWPALANLIHQLGISHYFSGDATLEGTDPILQSPHYLGEAISTVLALDGIAASAIWEYRTRHINIININILDAIHHLHPTHFLWQSDYKLNLGVENVPTNGLFKCKDGRHIMIESGPPYPKLQAGYLNFFNCGNTKEALQKEISKWHSKELEDALSKAGLPACIAYTKEEWRAHPQGKILSQKPLIEIEKIAEGEPQGFSSLSTSPLNGIKVLDFTHVLAGPRSSRTLAEFGADVLHISSP